ncbi:MAG: helix-turn-helix domain-containing protein [Gemmatimonadota bacterium]
MIGSVRSGEFEHPAPLGSSGRTPTHAPALLSDLVGSNPVFRDVLAQIEQASRDPRPLLLLGEPGTGKRLTAHVLHRLEPLRAGPLLGMDCSELEPDLIERELFGDPHTMGLLDVSAGGTLVLRRMDVLAARTMRRLRRTFTSMPESRRPRLIGTWRVPYGADSYGSAGGAVLGAVFEDRALTLPPLRLRGEDLEALTDHFLAHAGVGARDVSAQARFALASHRWPGNVRELRSVIRKAALRAPNTIELEHLAIQARTPALRAVSSDPERLRLEGRSLAEIEADAVRQTLRLTRGNRTAAARLLGISRPTLLRKIRQYGADRS